MDLSNASKGSLIVTALAVLFVTTSGGLASEYPCSLASNHVLTVQSWSAEALPDGRTDVTVLARLNDRPPPGTPKNEELTDLGGFILLSDLKGHSHAFFGIDNPGHQPGSDDYVFSRTIDSNSNVTTILASPRSEIRAFVCLSNWTWSNGTMVIAN